MLYDNVPNVYTAEAAYPMPYESFKVVKRFIECSEKDDISELEYCLEELAELIQAIQKLKRARKRGNKLSEKKAKKHLVEEIAHVYLTLNHIRDQESISLTSIQLAINEKIEEWGFKNE